MLRQRAAALRERALRCACCCGPGRTGPDRSGGRRERCEVRGCFCPRRGEDGVAPEEEVLREGSPSGGSGLLLLLL